MSGVFSELWVANEEEEETSECFPCILPVSGAATPYMFGRIPGRLHPKVREFCSTHVCCRSGLFHFPQEVAGHVYGSLSTPIAIDALIEEFEDFPLKFDPGTQFGYNNAGYSMLVKVIEEVSETSFDDYLQTKVFTPTRMYQTAADWDSASQDLAIGYEKVDGEFIRSPADHPSHFVRAGTTYSTVDDMYNTYT